MPTDRDKTHLLFKRVGRAADKLPQQPTPENVHAFRTSARRLETLVHAVTPNQHRKLLKQLRRLRRRAGTLRDLDVQINALRNFKIMEDSARKSQLMATLLDLRARRERKLLKAFDEESRAKLQSRLQKVAGQMPPIEKALPDPLAVAHRRFAQLAREHATTSEEALHEYRLRCKRIRYIAELSQNDEAQAFVSDLVRLQDATGDWRDWLLLTASAERQFRDAPRSALLAALRNVTRAKFSDAARVCTQIREVFLKRTQPAAAKKERPGARRAPTSVEFEAAAAATA